MDGGLGYVAAGSADADIARIAPFNKNDDAWLRTLNFQSPDADADHDAGRLLPTHDDITL